MLKLEGVTVKISDERKVGPITVEVLPGEILAVTGPNGSGKTTLLSAVAGLRDHEGKLLLDGIDISSEPLEEKAALGIILAHQKIPHVPLPVERIIASAAVSIGNIEPDEALARAAHCLRRFKLSENYLSRRLDSGLSGGELKKLELAQVYALRPRFALLDEVDSGVDRDSVAAIAECVRNMTEERTGIMIVTHSDKLLNELGKVRQISLS